MKNTLLVLLSLTMILFSTSAFAKKVWVKEIPNRNGLYYEPYSTTLANGQYETYHNNGYLKSSEYFIKGKRAGLYESYEDDGQLIERGTYKDGGKDGFWRGFYYNGQLSWRVTYKDGKREGLYESYHLFYQEQLLEKSTYKDGELDGPYEAYHNDGQLAVRTTYKNGEPDGPYVSYHKDGQLYVRTTYKDGELDGPYEEYYENGQLNKRETYKDGEIAGYEKYGRLTDSLVMNNGPETITFSGATLTNIPVDLNLRGGSKGVYVSAVEIGSEAQRVGLVKGDIIRSINRRDFQNLENFNKLTKGGDGPFALSVERNGNTFYVAIK